MKKFIVIASMALLVVNVFADERYVIVSREGRDNSILCQPSYEIKEGRVFLKSLKRVCASRFNGCEFWNENSKGILVLCRFQEDKSAWVYIDKYGKPLYLEGCRGGTFFNRICLLEEPERPVAVQQEPQVVQKECQEFYPDTPPMQACEERESFCEPDQPMFQGRNCGQFQRRQSCNYGYRPPMFRERTCRPMPMRMNRNCPPMMMRRSGCSQFRGR